MARRWGLVGVVVTAVAVCLACGLEQSSAKARVQSMMTGWQAGGTSGDGNNQMAASQFYAGRDAIDDAATLSVASDRFDDFRRQKDLFRSVSGWEIQSVEKDSTTSDASKVTLTIEGTSYALIVIPGQPIQWGS